MINLDIIAINNAKVLIDINTNTEFISFKNKIVLEKKNKDDNYENITELDDIEYALYFTFNHLITMNNLYFKRNGLLSLIINSYNNVYNLYENTIDDKENERIAELLDHIGEVLEKVNDNNNFYYYYYKIQDYFSYLLTGFKTFSYIAHDFNNNLIGNSFYDDSDDSINENESEDEVDRDKEVKDEVEDDVEEEVEDKEVEDKVEDEDRVKLD